MRSFYGIETHDFKVVVEDNDVVLDAGSWIGDFAAYAVKCGAIVYAFEPTFETYKLLLETATLNPGINPINSGLGAKKERLPLFITDEHNTGSNTMQQMMLEILQGRKVLRNSRSHYHR
jgi:FkbM family methyltransferase